MISCEEPAEVEEPLLPHIKKKQLRWFGYLVRMPPAWNPPGKSGGVGCVKRCLGPPAEAAALTNRLRIKWNVIGRMGWMDGWMDCSGRLLNPFSVPHQLYILCPDSDPPVL